MTMRPSRQAQDWRKPAGTAMRVYLEWSWELSCISRPRTHQQARLESDKNIISSGRASFSTLFPARKVTLRRERHSGDRDNTCAAARRPASLGQRRHDRGSMGCSRFDSIRISPCAAHAQWAMTPMNVAVVVRTARMSAPALARTLRRGIPVGGDLFSARFSAGSTAAANPAARKNRWRGSFTCLKRTAVVVSPSNGTRQLASRTR